MHAHVHSRCGVHIVGSCSKLPRARRHLTATDDAIAAARVSAWLARAAVGADNAATAAVVWVGLLHEVPLDVVVAAELPAAAIVIILALAGEAIVQVTLGAATRWGNVVAAVAMVVRHTEPTGRVRAFLGGELDEA